MSKLQTIERLPAPAASSDSPMMRPLPKYPVASLPLADSMRDRLVLVTDEPQGLATSVVYDGVYQWRSEVDGNILGPGNG